MEVLESTKNSLSERISCRKRREEQQTSSGTGARTGPAGWMGSSTCQTTSFPTPRMAFCSWQPCHHVSYETSMLPEGSEIWRMELVWEISWIEELWKADIWKERHSPGENLLEPWRDGSGRKKLDSGRANWLSKLKLEDQIPSHEVDEIKHRALDIGGTVHGGWNQVYNHPGEELTFCLSGARVSGLRREEEIPEPQKTDSHVGCRELSTVLGEPCKDLQWEEQGWSPISGMRPPEVEQPQHDRTLSWTQRYYGSRTGCQLERTRPLWRQARRRAA